MSLQNRLMNLRALCCATPEKCPMQGILKQCLANSCCSTPVEGCVSFPSTAFVTNGGVTCLVHARDRDSCISIRIPMFPTAQACYHQRYGRQTCFQQKIIPKRNVTLLNKNGNNAEKERLFSRNKTDSRSSLSLDNIWDKHLGHEVSILRRSQYQGNILIRVVKESGILLLQGPQIKQVLPMEKELFNLVRKKNR